MSYPHIWNIEKEKDRENEKLRDRLAKLNKKNGDMKLEQAIKKTKLTNFVGGATFTFCSGGEKIRNASSQQGEKRAALEIKQKGIQATKFFCEHIQQFFHKTCNEEVSRCNNNEKKM